MSHKCKCNNGSSIQNRKQCNTHRCQIKTGRLVKLKTAARIASNQNKIFSIYGICNALRKALLERGWVERFPTKPVGRIKVQNNTSSDKKETESKLDKILLSGFAKKFQPNLIWHTKDFRHKANQDIKKESDTMINTLGTDAIWTSKQGLCTVTKQNYWFYIENVAEVESPRTYDVSDASEIPDFEEDYKITACTSLLKWIVLMVANEKPIFTITGTISLKVILFALNRCKEYILRKQNKDIDLTMHTISDNKWNSFLKKYYSLISEDVVFQSNNDRKITLYFIYSKCILKEMNKYRPQLNCDGYNNIWILKPSHCSRGRGIKMASKITEIKNIVNIASSKFIIQKYIEEPLLIYETKFDIRQYYLVTSTYPLVIWMYKDCYLRFSSQKYNLKDFNESIHLTNNAIQRKYYNRKGRHPDLPKNNMWDLEKYKTYLNTVGKEQVWENIVYPGMQKSIVCIMLSSQDTLLPTKNRFELYGCDFILDQEYTPWLIEINSNPDLSHTTQVTAKICPAVISDIVKVVIDHANDPNMSTGKFECVYTQSMTSLKHGNALLAVQGISLPNEVLQG